MKPALQALAAPARTLPAYVPSGNECALFEHAWRHRLPVLLKGPTGLSVTEAVLAGMIEPLTDDQEIKAALVDVAQAVIG